MDSQFENQIIFILFHWNRFIYKIKINYISTEQLKNNRLSYLKWNFGWYMIKGFNRWNSYESLSWLIANWIQRYEMLIELRRDGFVKRCMYKAFSQKNAVQWFEWVMKNTNVFKEAWNSFNHQGLFHLRLVGWGTSVMNSRHTKSNQYFCESN